MSNKVSVLRGPKEVVAKSRAATFAMTTGTAVCTVPKGSRLLGAILTGVAASTATTATLSIGTSATATELGSANVLAAGIGNGGFIGFDATANDVLTADTKIYLKYAESGGVSATGSWIVTLLYTTGNKQNNDVVQ